MPAIIIRAEVFGSDELKAFGEFMGWSERECLGCLALLWQGSQKRKLDRATARQIGYWCRSNSQDERSRLVDALADELVGFIKKTDDDSFEIVGNKKQIEKLRALKTSSKKGGKKTREKWKAEKAQKNPEQDAEPNGLANATPNAEPSGVVSSSLFSTLLNSSSLLSSRESAAEVPQVIPKDIPADILEANERLLEARKNLRSGQPLAKGFLGFGRLGFST